jgi:16S rRNA (guanine527-N7)-methyltransferase
MAEPRRHSEREQFADRAHVSRETLARLDIYVALLHKWQVIQNLIAPSTLEQVWSRHIDDSAQLLDHAPPDWRTWVDLGTGGGFPGLVIAIMAAGADPPATHLVESDRRKCAFLRTVVRETGIAAEVHASRIEEVSPEISRADVVSARALAPLPRLLELAAPFLQGGAVGLFPKGRGILAELTMGTMSRSYRFELLPSRSDSDGQIVRVRSDPASDQEDRSLSLDRST